jgi:hypothetical protein
LILRWRCGFEDGKFSLAREVDGFGEDFGGLLWGVEAHRVFGGDEIESPLGLPLQFEPRLKLFLAGVSFLAATIASIRS